MITVHRAGESTHQEITFPTWPYDRLRILHTRGEKDAVIEASDRRDGESAVLVPTIEELREIRDALTMTITELEHS